jgi:hypothetical protein
MFDYDAVVAEYNDDADRSRAQVTAALPTRRRMGPHPPLPGHRRHAAYHRGRW